MIRQRPGNMPVMQRRPRRRADRRGGVVLREPRPLLRHPVEVRASAIARAAVAAQVAGAEVVGEDEDDVRTGGGIGGADGRSEAESQGKQQKWAEHRGNVGV